MPFSCEYSIWSALAFLKKCERIFPILRILPPVPTKIIFFLPSKINPVRSIILTTDSRNRFNAVFCSLPDSILSLTVPMGKLLLVITWWSTIILISVEPPPISIVMPTFFLKSYKGLIARKSKWASRLPEITLIAGPSFFKTASINSLEFAALLKAAVPTAITCSISKSWESWSKWLKVLAESSIVFWLILPLLKTSAPNRIGTRNFSTIWYFFFSWSISTTDMRMAFEPKSKRA